MRKTVVGLGEVLWDILPARRHLGGAPANFAYISSLMGNRSIVASRVGVDELGTEARRHMQALGLADTFVQRDENHPTGTAKAEIDRTGEVRFDIAKSAAWDFLEWTSQWQALAEKVDAVCFGSLAQRSPKSRETIGRFLRATRPEAVRVFDVNLRQPFYSRAILCESIELADIVKLNDEELPKIMNLGKLDHVDENSSARRLLSLYGLKLVCITRGSRGSLLVNSTESNEHPGFPVKVADTIGAGDAFTAALVHEYLQGASLTTMNEAANLVGAWVASQVGATPVPKQGKLGLSLAEIARLQ